MANGYRPLRSKIFKRTRALRHRMLCISGRMRARAGHFMPETLLQSQFDALEDPSLESDTISVSIVKDPDSIALDAIQALQSQGYVPSKCTA